MRHKKKRAQSEENRINIRRTCNSKAIKGKNLDCISIGKKKGEERNSMDVWMEELTADLDRGAELEENGLGEEDLSGADAELTDLGL